MYLELLGGVPIKKNTLYIGSLCNVLWGNLQWNILLYLLSEHEQGQWWWQWLVNCPTRWALLFILGVLYWYWWHQFDATVDMMTTMFVTNPLSWSWWWLQCLWPIVMMTTMFMTNHDDDYNVFDQSPVMIMMMTTMFMANHANYTMCQYLCTSRFKLHQYCKLFIIFRSSLFNTTTMLNI